MSAVERVLVAAGALSLLGLLEWLVLPGLAAGTAQADASRSLLAVVVTYGGVGLAAGAALALATRRRPEGAAARATLPLAGALGAWLVAFAAARIGTGALALLAALALGGTAVRLALAAGGRLPVRPGARAVAIAHGLALAAGVALAARRAPDTTGLAAGAVAAAIGAALLLAPLAQRRLHAGPAALLAHALLLGACAVLSSRVAREPAGPAPPPGAPSVLLVTIDTLRADHVGVYGHAPARTPNLDGLAGEGVRFRTVVAPTPLTGPSHASILTGLLPSRSGVRVNMERLPRSVPALPDALRARGYASAAFVSGWTAADAACGLPSRFDHRDDDFRRLRLIPNAAWRVALLDPVRGALEARGVDFAPLRRDAAAVTGAALSWLGRGRERPFLLWVHYFDPHLPYELPPGRLPGPRDYAGPVSGRWYSLDAAERAAIAASPEHVARMIDLYDAAIAHADEQLGRLHAAALRAAPGGRLLTVVTADHGESMGEHELYWDRDLYDPTLLVPLILHPPAGERWPVREVAAQVRLIDVTPTILDLLGADLPPGLDGRSLAGLLRGTDRTPPGPALSAAYVEDASLFRRESYAVRHEQRKLIRRLPGWKGRVFQDASRELYDLGEDPGELRNLAEGRQAWAASLESHLDRVARRERETRELGPEERERLRRLGYLE